MVSDYAQDIAIHRRLYMLSMSHYLQSMGEGTCGRGKPVSMELQPVCCKAGFVRKYFWTVVSNINFLCVKAIQRICPWGFL